PKYMDTIQSLGVIKTGFIGTVDSGGALNLYDGNLRLMKADGSYTDFAPADYTDYIGEYVPSWSYGKFPYAKFWNEGFSLDLDHPKGVYRSNTLARINVADHMSTPAAQEELEEFRNLFGRPAQATLLYHYARLIEEVYASLWHWRQIGQPINILRGKWMICHVYTLLEHKEEALYHANEVMRLKDEINPTDWDLAYCYEAMARVMALHQNKDEFQRYYDLALEAGKKIAGEGDRKQFDADMTDEYWFGMLPGR
ncbi:MAG: hypothetical protein R6T89_07690, partial [Candidatus Syntrophosphaera sp.]